ncbi:pyridoxal phosphate-dependent aminotransferase [Ekhidna sp. To15]|uniref:pyridoxal phosphate-dependent aminotransferase n=1 Tax=Ekhidna sp. To15 TaxID=3395267 RepID=UPI003F51EDF0
MSTLSKRIKSIPESATLAMAAKAREMKEKGVEVISLSLGEPDFKTPKHIQEGAIEAIQSEKYFAYPPVNGYLDLRKAISEKFQRDNGLEYTPDQIVVSNGAKQSIANVFMAILNPGDEVIVLTPYWVSYSAMILLAEGTPVFVSGTIENDFKATADQIKDAITDKTKALIFSSPCNPTGSVFNREELEAIADVLKDRKDITVISDEIYELINFGSTHESIGTIGDMIDRTVTVNGFSKGFAMTGWRVGYIGAPTWIAKASNKMQGQYTSGNCSIAQRASLSALTGPMEPSREMAKAYEKRRALVYELLKDIPGFEVNMPQGAFYFFPNVKHYLGKMNESVKINTVNDLCMYLLEDARVSLVTGEAFGDSECLRLSYAASEDDLRTAIARIKESLAKLK